MNIIYNSGLIVVLANLFFLQQLQICFGDGLFYNLGRSIENQIVSKGTLKDWGETQKCTNSTTPGQTERLTY